MTEPHFSTVPVDICEDFDNSTFKVVSPALLDLKVLNEVFYFALG